MYSEKRHDFRYEIWQSFSIKIEVEQTLVHTIVKVQIYASRCTVNEAKKMIMETLDFLLN